MIGDSYWQLAHGGTMQTLLLTANETQWSKASIMVGHDYPASQMCKP